MNTVQRVAWLCSSKIHYFRILMRLCASFNMVEVELRWGFMQFDGHQPVSSRLDWLEGPMER